MGTPNPVRVREELDNCFLCTHYISDFFECIGTCMLTERLIRDPACICEEYERYDALKDVDF